MLKIYHLIDMKNLFYSITLLLFPILTHSQSFQWQANKPLDRKLNNKIEQWLDIGVTETERLFYRLPQKNLLHGNAEKQCERACSMGASAA